MSTINKSGLRELKIESLNERIADLEELNTKLTKAFDELKISYDTLLATHTSQKNIEKEIETQKKRAETRAKLTANEKNKLLSEIQQLKQDLQTRKQKEAIDEKTIESACGKAAERVRIECEGQKLNEISLIREKHEREKAKLIDSFNERVFKERSRFQTHLKTMNGRILRESAQCITEYDRKLSSVFSSIDQKVFALNKRMFTLLDVAKSHISFQEEQKKQLQAKISQLRREKTLIEKREAQKMNEKLDKLQNRILQMVSQKDKEITIRDTQIDHLKRQLSMLGKTQKAKLSSETDSDE